MQYSDSALSNLSVRRSFPSSPAIATSFRRPLFQPPPWPEMKQKLEPPLSSTFSSSNARTKGNPSSKCKSEHACSFFAKFLVLILSFIACASGMQVAYILFDMEHWTEDQTCPVKTWSYPNCRNADSNITQTIPTAKDWFEMRQAYKNAVRDHHFSLEWSTWTNGSATGFHVPCQVRYSSKRGRGLYAAADIPKGTMIWDNRYTARVFSECEGRLFVRNLSNDLACNVVMWGYVTDHGTGSLEWGIDLDPCSFTNQATTSADINVEDRVVEPAKATHPGGHSMWATRDIFAGEELLSNYEDLKTFDLRKNLFWHVKLMVKSWGFIFLY